MAKENIAARQRVTQSGISLAENFSLHTQRQKEEIERLQSSVVPLLDVR